MENKKGIQRDVLMAMILGLLVVAIVLYFIFHEYFTQNDLNLESCRQSVILRESAPELTAASRISLVDLKSKFPLKCKSQVKLIDFKDKDKAGKLITDSLAECWYLYGEEQYALFPQDGQVVSYCSPCARIHFNSDVKDFYKEESNTIYLKDYLDKILARTQISYGEYLKKAFLTYVLRIDAVGGLAINFLGVGDSMSKPMVIDGDSFKIDNAGWTLGTELGTLTLPNKINPDNGDVLIFFQQAIFGGGVQDSNVFYFQSGQKIPDPFKMISSTDFKYLQRKSDSAVLCENFDGIPA